MSASRLSITSTKTPRGMQILGDLTTHAFRVPSARVTRVSHRSRPSHMAPRSAPNAAEAAYRRFLAQQKEGLRSWAKRRAALLDEVGMSADMEQLVVDLLEELRDEPAALAGASLFFESPLLWHCSCLTPAAMP